MVGGWYPFCSDNSTYIFKNKTFVFCTSIVHISERYLLHVLRFWYLNYFYSLKVTCRKLLFSTYIYQEWAFYIVWFSDNLCKKNPPVEHSYTLAKYCISSTTFPWIGIVVFFISVLTNWWQILFTQKKARFSVTLTVFSCFT